jgi:hypothetical protein
LSHRIGILVEGADADVVLWDSHPLQLGATPRQVWIDGIAQLRHTPSLTPSPSAPPVLVGEPKRGLAAMPPVPNWDAERAEAVAFEGLQPLGPKKRVRGTVVLQNVAEVFVRYEEGIKERWSAKPGAQSGTVVLRNGKLACVGDKGWCLQGLDKDKDEEKVEIDLQGGAVGPGLMTFGSPLGIEEITQEPSTGDGFLYQPYSGDTPKILHDTAAVVRAVDALQFGTRNAL